MNMVIMRGKLTSNPELNVAENDKFSIRCDFCIAVDYLKRKSVKDDIDYFNCIAFDRIAENIIQWFNKDDEIIIIGTLNSDEYEKDGENHFDIQIIVNEFHFGMSKFKPKPDEKDLEKFEELLNNPDISF